MNQDEITKLQVILNDLESRKRTIDSSTDPSVFTQIGKDISTYFNTAGLQNPPNVKDQSSLNEAIENLQSRIDNLSQSQTTAPANPPSAANTQSPSNPGSSQQSNNTPQTRPPIPPSSINDDDVITYIEVLDAGTDPFGSKISQRYYKLSTFILPCPSNLMDLHSVNFEGRDFGTANYLLDKVAGSSTRYQVGWEQSKRLVEYGIQRGQYALGAMNNDYLAETLNIKARQGDDQGYDVYSIAKGVAINPNTELVFRGVNVREFQLNWKLINFDNKIYYSLTQNGSILSNAVLGASPTLGGNIPVVSLLLNFYYEARKLMYPMVDSSFASGYPAKFAITVRKNTSKNVASSNTREVLVSIGNGKLNRNGEKMGCYIKDLQLDYIPSDSSFGASISSYPTVVLENGEFQEISLSMTVQEAALLNRQSISDIYSE